MSTGPSNHSDEFVGIAKAVGAILGAWLAMFAVTSNIVSQPITALVVSVVTAILVSFWVVRKHWVGLTQVIIAWLLLTVIVLAGFVIWPKTMTVEGFVRDSAGNPLGQQEVLFFDLSGRRYEATTTVEGYYQFTSVPTGKYSVRVPGSTVEGKTTGILVRVVQQNITVPMTPAPPTSTPTASPCPGETTFERVKCTGVIRVGIANEYPYGFTGSGDKLSGEAIEVARIIFKRLGIPEMEGVVTEFETLIPALQAGRFDVITAGMYIQPERCEQVLFANPEYKSIVEGKQVFGAAAFRQEDADLRDAFNAELKKLKDSGELEDIITQFEGYFGDKTSVAGSVTAEELCNP